MAVPTFQPSSVPPEIHSAASESETSDVKAVRARLLANGYRFVPVLTGGKRPLKTGWTERARHQTPEDAVVFDSICQNTGILCDGLRSVDIDCDDPTIAAQVQSLSIKMLGPAPVRSRSNSPRSLFVYRAAEGSPGKRTVQGERGKVEILGLGQQFVAFGEHTSGVDYTWPDSSPLNIRKDELTAVKEQEITDFLAACTPIIGASSAARPKPAAGKAVQDAQQVYRHPNRTPCLCSLIGKLHSQGKTAEEIIATALTENAAKCHPPKTEEEVRLLAEDLLKRYPPPGFSTGRFFAIDARIWSAITAYGMIEAVVYLALACGTGQNNRSTSWSTQSAKKHCGLGWNRAKQAMNNLISGGFIRYADSHTESFPRYELATSRELVDFQSAKDPPADPDRFDRKLLMELQAGNQPTSQAARNHAECLSLRGLVRGDTQGIFELPEPVVEGSGANLIWLPKSIVMGLENGEESPIQCLRGAGILSALRLFVNLYREQNLRDDGGISPRILRLEFDRLKVGQRGAYTIWGFKPNEVIHCENGPFATDSTGQQTENNLSSWEIVDLLKSMGLFSFVPHIFDNDTEFAEPIHAYGIGGIAEDPLEGNIGDAANKAARAMVLPSPLKEAEQAGFLYFCPIQRIKPKAQMIGVGRLTYRPSTLRTQAWFTELHEKATGWTEAFRKMAEKDDKADIKAGAKCA